MNTTYKQWLDNEYRLWGEALRESTVHNFKEHPMVKRMLSEELEWPDAFCPTIDFDTYNLIKKIDDIGRTFPAIRISDPCWRMVYYASKILDHNPISVVEIGGGVGEFYAVLRTLGYIGEYFIMDFIHAKVFQDSYLREVTRQTDLQFPQYLNFDFCVSFYALGEFDDELKQWYIDTVVSNCPHGFVLWNPHSGASTDIPFPCTVLPEYPMTHSDCKQLEW